MSNQRQIDDFRNSKEYQEYKEEINPDKELNRLKQERRNRIADIKQLVHSINRKKFEIDELNRQIEIRENMKKRG